MFRLTLACPRVPGGAFREELPRSAAPRLHRLLQSAVPPAAGLVHHLRQYRPSDCRRRCTPRNRIAPHRLSSLSNSAACRSGLNFGARKRDLICTQLNSREKIDGVGQFDYEVYSACGSRRGDTGVDGEPGRQLGGLRSVEDGVTAVRRYAEALSGKRHRDRGVKQAISGIAVLSDGKAAGLDDNGEWSQPVLAHREGSFGVLRLFHNDRPYT